MSVSSTWRAQRRDGAALGVRAEQGDHPVTLAALADQARLAGHREPGLRQVGPARGGVVAAPAVELGGRQVDRLEAVGRVEQAGRGGDLGDERDGGLVHAEVAGGAAQVAHARPRPSAAARAGAPSRCRRARRPGAPSRAPRWCRAGRARRARARSTRDLRRLGVDGAERCVAQRQPDLAGQLDGLGVDRDEQAAHRQQRRPAGSRRGRSAQHADRRTGGEPVEDVALLRVAVGDQVARRGRVGEHVGDRRARRGLRGGRQSRACAAPARAETSGTWRSSVGGGPAEPGRVGAERLAHRAGQVQVVVGCPRPGRAVAQLVQGRGRRRVGAEQRGRVVERDRVTRRRRTSTSASSTRSANASSPSTARCTDVRTDSRLASVGRSAGAGSARSGRRRSSSASWASVRPRSHSVSDAGRRAAARAGWRSPVAGQRPSARCGRSSGPGWV